MSTPPCDLVGRSVHQRRGRLLGTPWISCVPPTRTLTVAATLSPLSTTGPDRAPRNARQTVPRCRVVIKNDGLATRWLESSAETGPPSVRLDGDGRGVFHSSGSAPTSASAIWANNRLRIMNFEYPQDPEGADIGSDHQYRAGQVVKMVGVGEVVRHRCGQQSKSNSGQGHDPKGRTSRQRCDRPPFPHTHCRLRKYDGIPAITLEKSTLITSVHSRSTP